MSKQQTEVTGLTVQTRARLWTPQEAADFLAMPVATLQTWRAKGMGPHGFRVGKHVRYRPEDVEAWIDRQAGRGEP